MRIEEVKAWAEEALTTSETGDEFADDLYVRFAQNVCMGGGGLPYYRFLYLAMRELRPSLAVELGVQHGVGTAHLAAGWCGGTIVGVDVEFKDETQTVRERYDCIQYIQADVIVAADAIAKLDQPIELLFIDDEHKPTHVRRELDVYTPLLGDEALVVFDNLHAPSYPGYGSVCITFRQFPHQRLELPELSPGWGFGIAIFRR